MTLCRYVPFPFTASSCGPIGDVEGDHGSLIPARTLVCQHSGGVIGPQPGEAPIHEESEMPSTQGDEALIDPEQRRIRRHPIPGSRPAERDGWTSSS